MDARDLEFNFKKASERLRGVTGKAAQGAENAYGMAYQQMVRAGLKPQIKHKYRSAKG